MKWNGSNLEAQKYVSVHLYIYTHKNSPMEIAVIPKSALILIFKSNEQYNVQHCTIEFNLIKIRNNKI